MIPFDELCASLERWSRRKELDGDGAPHAALADAAPRDRQRAAAGGAPASWTPPAELAPPPKGPARIEAQYEPPEDPTGEIDLDDVVDE